MPNIRRVTASPRYRPERSCGSMSLVVLQVPGQLLPTMISFSAAVDFRISVGAQPPGRKAISLSRAQDWFHFSR